jgi:hypothetical protein
MGMLDVLGLKSNDVSALAYRSFSLLGNLAQVTNAILGGGAAVTRDPTAASP